jgi:hypothetical protein
MRRGELRAGDCDWMGRFIQHMIMPMDAPIGWVSPAGR